MMMINYDLQVCEDGILIRILYIMNHPVFYLKQDLSATGFCFRLQVEPAKLGLVDGAGLSLRTPVAAWWYL
jgi:hypothetical protein